MAGLLSKLNPFRRQHTPRLPVGARELATGTERALHADNTRLRRELHTTQQTLGYRGAQGRDHNEKWRPTSDHPDVAISESAALLRARSRDLVISRSLPKGYLQILCDNVIGDGIVPEPRARFRNGEGLIQGVNRQLKELWEMMSPVIEAQRIRNMTLLQRQTLRAWAEGGACLLYMPIFEADDLPIPLQVQGIEPEYLDGGVLGYLHTPGSRNEIRRGVELDRTTERIVAFHVKDARGTTPGAITRRLPAEDCVYAFCPERWGQVLGVPWLASTLTDFEDLEDYLTSENARARHFAKRSHYIKTNNPAEKIKALTELDIPATDGSTRPRIEEIYAGTTYLAKDEEPISLDSNIPPSNFKEFAVHLSRHVAAGSGMSYESLMGDHSDTHFSASRATWQRDVKFFRGLQRLMIDRVLQPMYERMVTIAVLSGYLDISRARYFRDAVYRHLITRVKWRTTGFPWFDPAKDVAAAEKQLALGLTTRRRLCDERGLVFEDVVEELAEEEALIRSKGLKAVSIPGDLTRMFGDAPRATAPAPGTGEAVKPSSRGGDADDDRGDRDVDPAED